MRVSNIFLLLHLVTVTGHDMGGLAAGIPLTAWLPQEVFSWRETATLPASQPASNKAVRISGRAGRALATFLSFDCCSLASQWEVTITMLPIISIQTLTTISSLRRKMRGSAKYFPGENVGIIF